MFPAIEILGKTVGTYALVALIGAFLSGTVYCILISKRGHDDNDAIIVLLFAALGAIVGSHFLYALVNYRYFLVLLSSDSINTAWTNLRRLFSGSVFYGGLLGALAAGGLAAKVLRVNMRVYWDCAAPIIPLFHGIARIGCFLAGCCYGIECSWGIVVYENPYIAGLCGVPRFPVQLLEASGNMLLSCFLFVLLQHYQKRPKLQGKLLYIYLIAYSCMRFSIEFLRGDCARGFWGVFSTSQWISIFIFAIAILAISIQPKEIARKP